MMSAIMLMRTTPVIPIFHPTFSALSGLPAPRFCPIRTEAAMLRAKAGRKITPSILKPFVIAQGPYGCISKPAEDVVQNNAACGSMRSEAAPQASLYSMFLDELSDNDHGRLYIPAQLPNLKKSRFITVPTATEKADATAMPI